MGVRLDHQNPRSRTGSANLQRQRESRHASSDDAHVVIRCWVIGVREARSDASRESLSCLLTHLRHLHSHVHALPFPRVVSTMYPAVRTSHRLRVLPGKRIHSPFDAQPLQHRARDERITLAARVHRESDYGFLTSSPASALAGWLVSSASETGGPPFPGRMETLVGNSDLASDQNAGDVRSSRRESLCSSSHSSSALATTGLKRGSSNSIMRTSRLSPPRHGRDRARTSHSPRHRCRACSAAIGTVRPWCPVQLPRPSVPSPTPSRARRVRRTAGSAWRAC